MSKEERRFPELRFKGFNDDWEQRKLNKILRVNSGKDYKHLSNGNIPVYGTGGYMLSVNDKLSNADGIGIGRKGTIDKPQFLKAPFWTVDTLFYLTSLPNYHILFLYYLSQNINWKKFDESTGVPSLSKKTIESIVKFTPYLEEQEALGLMLKRIDDVIELHQRKTTILNKIKKIYFEKLFSIDKKLLPKLRFKYYDKLWELRKLENLIEESGSGGTPKSTNSEYYNGNIPFLSISDISKSNGYINSTEKYITETGLRNSAAWIVPKGAVSLAMYASVGKVAILNIDATTSQAFYNMVFDNDNLRDFVYHRLNKANELNEWVRLISTGTQSNLNAKKVKNFEITLPANNEEISKISSILNNLETNINLNKRKVKLLLKIKQAYLKKVFI